MVDANHTPNTTTNTPTTNSPMVDNDDENNNNNVESPSLPSPFGRLFDGVADSRQTSSNRFCRLTAFGRRSMGLGDDEEALDEYAPPATLHPDTSRRLLDKLRGTTTDADGIGDDSLADCVLVSSQGRFHLTTFGRRSMGLGDDEEALDEYTPPSTLHPYTSRRLLDKLSGATTDADGGGDDSLADCVLVSSQGTFHLATFGRRLIGQGDDEEALDEYVPLTTLHPDTSRRLLDKLRGTTTNADGGGDDSLADCVLVSSQGVRLKAHKNVLSVSIPYLEKVFRYHHNDLLRTPAVSPNVRSASSSGIETTAESASGGGKDDDAHLLSTSSSFCPTVMSVVDSSETGGGTRRLQVQTEFDERLLRLLLEYAYTKRIEQLDIATAIELIPLADQWNCEGVIDECTRRLAAALCTDNCLLLGDYARHYGCRRLADAARTYALENVADVSRHVGFYQMDAEAVVDLLDDDRLNVDSESDVWRLIAGWIDPSPAEMPELAAQRIQHFAALFSTLRTGLCRSLLDKHSPDYIGRHSLFRRFPAASDSLQNAIQEAETNSLMTSTTFDLAQKTRRPRMPRDVIFAVGGWMDGNPIAGIETYDVKADRWFIMNADLLDANPRAYHAMVEYNGNIYIVGGFDGTEYYNSVRSFNVASREWKESAPMYVARCYVSAAVLNGRIYAVGGYDGRMRLRSVERFDPAANQWSLIEPMHRARSDACIATHNGRLYVAGGFNGDDVLTEVEYYCPEARQWFDVQALPSPRSGVNMAVVNEQLIVVGGFDGVRYAGGAWVTMAPMRHARSNFAVAVLDERLYALGGFDGETTVGHTERYDARDGVWRTVAPLFLARSAVKAVTVRRCPDAKRYSFHGAAAGAHGR